MVHIEGKVCDEIEGENACHVCGLEFDKFCDDLKVKSWKNIALYKDELARVIDDWINEQAHAMRENAKPNPPRDRAPGEMAEGHRGDGSPPHKTKHVYELTLTSDKDDIYDMRTALDKIVKSKMFDVKAFNACVELTQNHLPHIHAILWMDCKYVDVSKVKKFWPKRYEFKPVRMIDNYLNYIQKENGNPIIQEYCANKGIPQFWK